jgi:hypothetical protein
MGHAYLSTNVRAVTTPSVKRAAKGARELRNRRVSRRTTSGARLRRPRHPPRHPPRHRLMHRPQAVWDIIPPYHNVTTAIMPNVAEMGYALVRRRIIDAGRR